MKTKKEIYNRISKLEFERKVILDDIEFQLMHDKQSEALVDTMKIPKLNAKISELQWVLN